jgi:hypothetical protein
MSKTSKETTANEKAVKVFDQSNKDFETLHFSYGKVSNVIKFKETSFNFCLKQLGPVANIIKDGRRSIPDEIPNPPAVFTAANDPFGAKKTAYLRKVSNREDLLAELSAKEPQLFAHIWTNMSKESRAQVEKASQQAMSFAGNLLFEDVDGDLCDENEVGAVRRMEVWDRIFGRDALSLIRRINSTHLAPDTGVEELNQEQTRIRYEDLKQYPGESILDYRRRFQHAVDAMHAVGIAAVPDRSLAARFIINLDNKYGAFKADLANWSKNGIKAYPQTLEAAFESASTYREATPVALTTGTAFFTESNRGRGRSTRRRGSGRAPYSNAPSEKVFQNATVPSQAGAKKIFATSICTKPCPLCQELHWQRDCPLIAMVKSAQAKKKADEEKVHVIFSRASVDPDGIVLATYPIDEPTNDSTSTLVNHHMPLDTILLDNQASISVFGNTSLLTNVRDADFPCNINGISAGGFPIVATQIGDYNGFNNIYACPEASANILSFSVTKLYCNNDYDRSTDTFLSTPPGDQTYRFEGKKGLYVYKIPSDENIFISSVAENLLPFTHREQQDAIKAKALAKVLGYPSPRSMIDMINNGTIINCPVTSKDISRAHQIYGPDLASLRGKSRKKTVDSAKLEFLPREITSDVVLNIDIMFVNSIAFLISVSTPLGLTMVNELGRTKGSRSLQKVAPALLQQLDAYAANQFIIRTIRTDNEGAINSMVSILSQRGITLNPSGAGSHVPVIERKILEVKARARSIVNSLPYRLALTFIVHLIFFCVSRINIVPNKTGLSNLSPIEAFKGRKVDFKKDLRIGFGEYAEVFNPYSDNSMSPRTIAGIALGSSGNVTGSVKFLSLDTLRTITRDQFIILPIPDTVISQMNQLAASDGDSNIIDDTDSSEDPNLDNPANDLSIIPPNDPNPLPPPDISDNSDLIVHDILGDQDLNVDGNGGNALRGGLRNIEVTDLPANPEPERRYNTRGIRNHWDPATHQKVYNISVKAALKQMPDEAMKSIYKELLQMIEKNVFKGLLPSYRHSKKVIKSFMFLKEKFFASGEFEKLKARLVAGGNMQDRLAILYEYINSPTASIPFLMIVACIAAKERRSIRTIDIGGAYLNADISRHEILMELDQLISSILIEIDPSFAKFLRSNGTIVVSLNKALYGCVESAKLWYNLISSVLIASGFSSNPLDSCIFNKDFNGDQCTVVIYVDDLFITCRNIDALDEIESLLKDNFKEIKSHNGLAHSYLGMTWDFSVPSQVKLTMAGYIDDILSESKIIGKVNTPATDNLFVVRDATNLDVNAKGTYHTLVAKLLYLAKRTRPDLLLAVSFLTTRVQSPDIDDLHKLNRVLKYLNGSSHLGMILRADEPMQILTYIDASYGVHVDGKSHSGLYVTLGGGSILSKSTRQKIVTKSSTESELVAQSDFASEAIFFKEFLNAQGIAVPYATIFQDNMSTIAMTSNGISKSDRTRHMNIRYFWTKERVDTGELKITYIPTEDMIADILTKPLQGDKFNELRSKLLNWQDG